MRMPGEAVPLGESYDPMTEAYTAREGRPYKPDMGVQAPQENVNPYDQFATDTDRAVRLERSRDLTNRAVQHFSRGLRGATIGYLENMALTAMRDPVAAAERAAAGATWALNPFLALQLRADSERRLGAVGPDDPETKAYAEKLAFRDLQYEGLPPSETLIEYGVSIGGELLGAGVDPVNMLPIARVSKLFGKANPLLASVIDQSTSNALLNTTINVAMQDAEMASGRRDSFELDEVGMQAGLGALLGLPFGFVFQGRAKAYYQAEEQRALTEALLGAPEPGKAPLGPRRRPKAEAAPEPLPPEAPPPQPAQATPESLLEVVEGDAERLNQAQVDLFGEVKGTRNLTPEDLTRLEDHLAGTRFVPPPVDITAEIGAPVAEPALQPERVSQAVTPERGIAGAEAVQPIGRDYRVFDPDELKVDAKRFQFKAGGDEAGVTGKLKGVKQWDPTKAGVTLIWESKAGEFFVADGHQRTGLAKKLKAEGQQPKILGLVLREADGITSEDARVIAAAKNIAEGTGSALDAAKILRTRPEIGVNLPPTSALVRDAQGIAKLSDDAFGMVVNKKVPENYAAIVGRLAPDQATHGELLGLLAKNEPANVIEAESIIRDALEAPTVQATMTDMFGTQEVTQILFKERAQILSAAATAIRKDRAAFSTLVREESRIAAAGNVLVSAENLERAQQDAALLQAIQSLARRKGPVADALARGAQALKEGGAASRQAVVRDFIEAVRREAQPPRPSRGLRGLPGQPEQGLAEVAARGFHGSPFDFRRFDMAKLGTGEGAQAFGHGLYFAGNKQVAEFYRNAVFDAAKIDLINARMSELAREMDFYRVPGKLREFTGPRGYELAAEYDALLLEKQKQGNLYEVEIKGQEEDFLDYDQPISQQSAKVKAALAKLAEQVPKSRWFTPEPEATFRPILQAILRGEDDRTGEQLLGMLAGRLNPKDRKAGHVAASMMLKEAGVPGIKYLDEQSRTVLSLPRMLENLKESRAKRVEWKKAPKSTVREAQLNQLDAQIRSLEAQIAQTQKRQAEGTRNYVVFDENLVEILKKNDEDVAFRMEEEPGVEGKPQLVLPGAEQRPSGLAQLRANAPLRPTVAQKPTDFGLFGDAKDQQELFRLRADGDVVDLTPAASSKEAVIGETSIVYAAYGEEVEIISVRTPVANRGQGRARMAMQVFTERLDEEGLPARAYSTPLENEVDRDGLIRFFEGLGFTPSGRVLDDGNVELIRWPMRENEAGLRRLVTAEAPIEEISRHPLIIDSVQRMEELPRTHEAEGYNSEKWRAERTFDFDGESVQGTGRAVDRLVEFAAAYSTRGPVRQEGKATIVLGPAAAGKSRIAERLAAERYAAIVDPDDVKRTLPEYHSGLGANAVHEESSDISSEVLSRLADGRVNLVLPKIGANAAGIEKLVLALKGLDYQVQVINLKVSYENAFRRMIERFLATGRLVNPEYVKFVGEKPAETYKILREKGVADGYAEIDGNGPRGEAAAVLDETAGALEGLSGLRRGGGPEADRGAREIAEAQEPEQIAARRRVAPRGQIPVNRPQRGVTGARQPADRLDDLGTELAQTFGFPVRAGRLKQVRAPGGKAVGQFDRKQGVIRLREMADYDTRTHEVAHAIETSYGADLDQIKRAAAVELEPLAYPGAAPNQKLSEGFAEWFRFYLTTPGYARRTAPQFTQAFETWMAGRDPDRFAKLQELQQRYFEWTRTPSQAVISADIVSTRRRGAISEAVSEARREGWRVALGGYFDKTYTALVDQAHPIWQLMDRLFRVYEQNTGRALDLPAAQDPYKLARMFPDVYSEGHMDIMHGVKPYHGGSVREGPGISDALAIALGDQWRAWDSALMTDFAAYLISRRALHEYARFHADEIPNPPTKFSEGDHRVTVVELEQAHPEWAQAAEMIYEWNRNLLKKKYEAGLIGEDIYARLNERPDYVPMHRDMTDLDIEPGVPGPRVLRASILKAFQGSKRSIINPIESMAHDAYMTNAIILQNDIVKAIDDLAQQAGPGSGKLVERIPTRQLKGTEVSVEEVLRTAAKNAGLNPNDIDQLTTTVDAALGGADAKATIFRMGEISEGKEPILYVWRNGQKQALRLADGEFGRTVYNTLTGMGKEMQGLWTAIASLPSTALRYGITTSPHFLVANYIRDQVSAWVLTGNGFIPFISGARGVVDELSQSEITRIYNSYWGIMGGANVAALDRGRGKRDIRALQKKGYAIKRFASWRGLAEFTEISETGTRLAVFRRAFERGRKEGLSDHEAAVEAGYTARDYIDFGRHGSKMLAARRLVTFLNAATQGLDKTIRTLTAEGAIRKAIAPYVNFRAGRPLSSRDVANLNKAASAWAKVTAIGLFGLGLSWLYRDDPEHEEISDYLRATHWMVKNGSGDWWAIPKPFELGFISNLFERNFESLYGQNPVSMRKFIEGLWEITAPPSEIPLVSTYFEIKHNRKESGAPIIPEHLQGLDPQLQYNAWTSDFSKKLSNGLASIGLEVSPAVLDHALAGFGGSWGRILQEASIDRANEKGAFDTLANSMSSRFLRDHTRGATSSRAFWEQISERSGKLAQTANSYQFMVEHGAAPDAEKYLASRPDNEAVYSMLEAHFEAEDKRLHPLRRAKDAILTVSGVRREIAGNRFKTAADDPEEQTPILLTGSEREQAQEILSRLEMTEARNALVIIEEPGWAQKRIVDREAILSELQLALPNVHEELLERFTKAKVYDFEAVRSNWPEVKARILTDRAEADLSDIVAEAR